MMHARWRSGLVIAVSMLVGGQAWSGDPCPHCPAGCEPPKPKKKWFEGPPPAPEAAVVFAVPAMVTRGQAVRVPESAVAESLRKAVAESVKAESAAVSPDTEERLDALERDVRELKVLMERLTFAVGRLAEQTPAAR